MGERQTTDLVVAALVMALGRRNPIGELVHHADDGTQYTSMEFTNRLADWKLNGSYSSVGDCYDNAATPSKRVIRPELGQYASATVESDPDG